MVESGDKDPSARKAGDISEATYTSLFKEYIGVELTVTNAVRIGGKANNISHDCLSWLSKIWLIKFLFCEIN